MPLIDFLKFYFLYRMYSVLHCGLTIFFYHKYVHNRVLQTQKTHRGPNCVYIKFYSWKFDSSSCPSSHCSVHYFIRHLSLQPCHRPMILSHGRTVHSSGEYWNKSPVATADQLNETSGWYQCAARVEITARNLTNNTVVAIK